MPLSRSVRALPGNQTFEPVVASAMIYTTLHCCAAHTCLKGKHKYSPALAYSHRKLADGLFLQSCAEVAELYPKIKYENIIIDNCCMQVPFLSFCVARGMISVWITDCSVVHSLYRIHTSLMCL